MDRRYRSGETKDLGVRGRGGQGIAGVEVKEKLKDPGL